jgi:mannose-1-phosphate guanylyltransferase
LTETAAPLYGLILAGGSGSRFWPLSRRALPKQFLAIGGDGRSLLCSTYDRLLPLAGAERILVAGNAAYRERTLEELPGLPPENFLGEPVGRNTAPCIGLAAHCVLGREPRAILLVAPADHVIGPDEEFHRAARFAADLLRGEPPPSPEGAEPLTVTLGIPPHEPATGYGYIQQGAELARGEGGLAAFRVARFREKPPLEQAKAYLESGEYLWNSGMFVWSAAGVLALIERHLPELARGLSVIAAAPGEPERFRRLLAEHFPKLPAISIDYGVLEHTTNAVTVRAPFHWDDVGSWGAAARYLESDGEGNHLRGRHVGLETRNCVIVAGKRLVGTVGLEGLVIVETEDALLVCSRQAVEKVKDLVELAEKAGHHDVL